MSIVWPCRLEVAEYVAAGKYVEVPRPDCPSCQVPMNFRSGYPRWVRVGEAARMWVKRAECTACSVSHALLPAFLLVRRLDPVQVIVSALELAVVGLGLRRVAAQVEVPHETARDWWRRYREQAAGLTAGLSSLAVSLGREVPALSEHPTGSGLEALEVAWRAAQQRVGEGVVGRFEFASLVTGGGFLTTTTSPLGRWLRPGLLMVRTPSPPTSRSPP